MGSRPPCATFVALLGAITIGCVMLSAAPTSAASDASAPGPWVRPVTGAVVRPFVEPRSRYGAGHRGVDLLAAPGTPVRAANDGEVTFAGSVAGTLHVVVLHAGGLRTSSSFLATIAVRRGDRVARGEVVGTTGSGGDHTGVLHFGLRVGERYVDPMGLFAPTDLTRLIRLVPVDAPEQAGFDPPSVERRSLAAALHLPRGVLAPASTAPSPGALAAIGGALSAVGSVASAMSGPVLAPLGSDIVAIGRRVVAWAASRDDCVRDGSQPESGGGSGHRVLMVAGINSETDPRTGTALPIDTGRLGYRAGEVRSFSYAADGGPYRREDTVGDLHIAAAGLATQLRAMQRDEPGREVDLVAHSQGGVVVAAFLALQYRPGDPTLPPLGTVVTMSSPLRGAPAATAIARVRGTTTGRAALDEVDRRTGGAVPPTGAVSTRQLAERSAFMRRLARMRLPEQIDFVSIGAADDVVVPADHTTAPGVRSVTINPAGLSDHRGILTDRAATDALRVVLEGRAAPCVGLADGIRGAVEPVVISRVERTAGQAGGAAGSASDFLLGTGGTP